MIEDAYIYIYIYIVKMGVLAHEVQPARTRLSAAAPFQEVPLGVCHAMASNRPPLLSWENSGGYKR